MARSNNLENWNPMSESFHDANFNSYQHGPGANLTPFDKTLDREHKLYVKNVPDELEETGIRQLFNTYGKTLDVMNPPDCDWAFVTYGSFREAETAIRMLNDKPPLYLKIQFSVKNKKGVQKQQPAHWHGIPDLEPVKNNYRVPETRQGGDYVSPENGPQFYRPILPDMTRSRDLPALVRSSDLPYIPDPHYENEDLVYPMNSDPNIYNPYPEALPYENTSNMWGRGRMKIANDGTRFVTMGRGYTWYELPPPRPNIHQQIRAVYEKREVGLYEYGENKLAPQIGKCQNCTQPASKFCQYCKEFYCSRICQEKDWPRHKIECQPMPPLEGGDGQFSPPASSVEDLPVLEPVPRPNRRLRRPFRAVETPAALPNSSSTPLPGASPKLGQSEIKKDEEKTSQLLDNNSGKRSQEVQKPVSIDDNDQAVRGIKNPAEGSRSNSSYELPKQKNKADLNTAGPSQRVETQKGIHANGFFPRKNEVKKPEDKNTEQITRGVETMKVNTETAKPIRKPRFDEPDFSFLQATKFLPGPSGVLSTPKVSFDTAAKAPAASKLCEAVDNDASKQAPCQAAKVLPSASRKEAGNIVELLENEEEGCFEVHILLGGDKAAVTVCVLKVQDKYAKILSDLEPACEKIPENPNFNPKVGDLVCGKRLNDWIRGTVVSLGPPMRLAAVDEGRVEQITAVKPIPDGFTDLPMLGATCEVTAGDLKLENMLQYFFKVKNNNPDNVSKDGVEVVIISAENKEGKGILRPWSPTPEQKGTPYAILKTDTEVCIASFRSHARMFVRSLDPKSLEIFNRITQEVAKWSTKVNKLTKPPVIGEILIAKYVEDNNFYRAIVRQIKDKNITVSYLDFGNLDTTTIDNLRPISDQLKEYPSCVANIVLKDVPTDVPINKEVHEYLGVLAGTEKPLMCTFSGVPSKDGVVLKCAGGTSVNEKIVELLTPSWKKEEDKTTAYMQTDLEIADLGPVGTSFHALVLFAYGPLVYTMAPYDIELIGHITDVMSSQMAEYCTQMKEHYIPRVEELCLAPFDGQWFRAVCLETNTSPTTSTVNFIDFGNFEVIPHTSLRLITKDFVTTKAMASTCHVTGFGPIDEKGDLPPAIAKRIVELVPTNNVVMIKILERSSPGEYVIELPEVREQLVKEGLL